MIRLPKKITPARIRESIVQVFFSSDIPFEPLVGYLYNILSNEFTLDYLNRPLPSPRQAATGIADLPGRFEINIGPRHFFFNEEIKIQLQPDTSLIFNCVGDYLGWTQYSDYIKRILSRLSETGVIARYHRVGVRYISEFANVDILDKVNFTFNLSTLSGDPASGNFRVEWHDKSHRIVLNLGTKLPQPPMLLHDIEKVDFISLIDVDVIQQNLDQPDFNSFWDILEKAHLKEKEVFFTLLRQDFLDSLNPEYE